MVPIALIVLSSLTNILVTFFIMARKRPVVAVFSLILAIALLITGIYLWKNYTEDLDRLRTEVSQIRQAVANDAEELQEKAKTLNANQEFLSQRWQIFLAEKAQPQHAAAYEAHDAFKRISQQIAARYQQAIEIDRDLTALVDIATTWSRTRAEDGLGIVANIRIKLERDLQDSAKLARELAAAERRLNQIAAQEAQVVYFELSMFADQLRRLLHRVGAGQADKHPNGMADEAFDFLSGLLYTKESLRNKSRRLNEYTVARHDEGSEPIDPDTEAHVNAAQKGKRLAPELQKIFAPPASTWYVTTSDLKVRLYPSNDSEVLRSLTGGESIVLVKKAGNWWKVETSKGIGWVNSKYLSHDPDYARP